MPSGALCLSRQDDDRKVYSFSGMLVMAVLTGPKTFLRVKKTPPDLGEQVGYNN